MTTKATTAPKAAQDFTDAGTGKSFKKGKPIEATAGELANYVAAGLVEGSDVPAGGAADA